MRPQEMKKNGECSSFGIALRRAFPHGLDSFGLSVQAKFREVFDKILDATAKNPHKFNNLVAPILSIRERESTSSANEFAGASLEVAAYHGWAEQCKKILRIRRSHRSSELGLTKPSRRKGENPANTTNTDASSSHGERFGNDYPEEESPVHWALHKRHADVLNVLIEFALLHNTKETLNEVLEELGNYLSKYSGSSSHALAHPEADAPSQRYSDMHQSDPESFLQQVAGMWFKNNYKNEYDWPDWLKKEMRFDPPHKPQNNQLFDTCGGAYTFGAPDCKCNSGKVYLEFTCGETAKKDQLWHTACGWADERYEHYITTYFPAEPGYQAWCINNRAEGILGGNRHWKEGCDKLPRFIEGNVIGMAADFEAGKLYFSKNGKFGKEGKETEMEEHGIPIGTDWKDKDQKLFPAFYALGSGWKVNLTGPFAHELPGFSPIVSGSASAKISFIGVGGAGCTQHLHEEEFGAISMFHLACLFGSTSLMLTLHRNGAEYCSLYNDGPTDLASDWMAEPKMTKMPVDFLVEERHDLHRAAVIMIGLVQLFTHVRKGRLKAAAAKDMLTSFLRRLNHAKDIMDIFTGSAGQLGAEYTSFYGEDSSLFHEAINAGVEDLVKPLFESLHWKNRTRFEELVEKADKVT